MTSSGTTPRTARVSTPLPPSASFSSGGMRPASSTSSWSRNGTRASRPQAIVMLSTRFTGSSTSMTVVSLRSAASTAVSAPGRPNCAAMNSVGASDDSSQSGSSSAAMSGQRRSKNTFEYSSTASDRGTDASGGYQL